MAHIADSDSKSVNERLSLNQQLSSYTEIVNQGCFYCGDYLNTDQIDYEYGHCVDICKTKSTESEPFVSVENWDLNQKDFQRTSDIIDQQCS